MKMDLTFYGLNKKARIISIERVDSSSEESEIALGTKDLNEEEKQYLQKHVPLAIPILIEKEN